MLKTIETAEQWIATELELLENPEYMTNKEHLMAVLKILDALGLSDMYSAAILSNQAVKEQGKRIERYESVIGLATVFLQKKNLEGEMLQWLIDNKAITKE
ncbi:hypothetical protein M7775_07970 [Sporomusa sphaeroides DSM 2875]|uniref:hypothetical protein n=1 Tax=Sporomusa sphaeroides TaxID=47679 RepID=UPI0020300540|nr:hypothetical protein [Sporomusa sphaeroides]MCM0758506.1 hypothetical protein [Sporomusa sphaeroides DSM 2875]